MEDKEMRDFSWTGLFLVTGICSFLFSAVMKMLEGTYIPLFTWMGIACLLLGSINGIGVLIIRTETRKKKAI
jgi:hypothetical protein